MRHPGTDGRLKPESSVFCPMLAVACRTELGGAHRREHHSEVVERGDRQQTDGAVAHPVVSGSAMQKRVPATGSLSTVTLPPCCSTSAFVIARPSPGPFP